MGQDTLLWIIIALLTGLVIGLGGALWFIGNIVRAWLATRERGLRIE